MRKLSLNWGWSQSWWEQLGNKTKTFYPLCFPTNILQTCYLLFCDKDNNTTCCIYGFKNFVRYIAVKPSLVEPSYETFLCQLLVDFLHFFVVLVVFPPVMTQEEIGAERKKTSRQWRGPSCMNDLQTELINPISYGQRLPRTPCLIMGQLHGVLQITKYASVNQTHLLELQNKNKLMWFVSTHNPFNNSLEKSIRYV